MHYLGNMKYKEIFKSSENISETMPVSLFNPSIITEILRFLNTELAAYFPLDRILVPRVLSKFNIIIILKKVDLTITLKTMSRLTWLCFSSSDSLSHSGDLDAIVFMNISTRGIFSTMHFQYSLWCRLG